MNTIDYPLLLELREGGDGRTLTGLAVPYGQTSHNVPHPGGEQFAPGAFKRSLDHARAAGRRLKLFRGHQHDTAVGVAIDAEDTDEGVLTTFHMADTDAGNAALTEVREGVLDSLSVGFRAIRERVVDGVRVVSEAALHEVSLVALPAYDGARITGLRDLNPSRIQIPPAPQVDMGPVVIGGVVWR